MRKYKEKIVYHYCSAETFMSIISNATLRACNIRKSNDYTEVINCIDVFMISMRNALQIYGNENKDDIVFHEFLKDLDTDWLIETAIDNESCTYYCVCFSEAQDLLSQWRGYADNGSGVAIGFDDRFFERTTDYCNMKYCPVEYNLPGVKSDLTRYIYNRIKKTHDVKKDVLTCSDYESTLSLIINAMVYNAIFYKNDAFSEEREWRLVYYPFGSVRNLSIRHKTSEMATHQLYYDKMDDIAKYGTQHKGLQRNPIQFMLRDKSITSYVDLSFRDVLPYCIREIVLGPKNVMDDLDLRLFLTENGVDLSFTKIVRSASTYR